MIRPALRLSALLAGAFSGLVACSDRGAEPPLHDAGAQLRAAAAEPVPRARQIRDLLEREKEWGGGHSPVPRRGATANTFAKLRSELTRADVPALLLLIEDDAVDVRSMAVSLLECLEPLSEQLVEQRAAQAVDAQRRSRDLDALIGIRAIRAGGTSCR
ncbi:hypothetical protein CKO44_03235 [Rubrivivax gelatinosus]|uniref:HEAT repeat protein n=1 Tax=Rubrivivax gelatinosus TaxID=28068 RepID=A0ABS1DRA4_RUBGE|nr:hypothetical protein [Rubrivivax gelatinosus]MBK1612476.1 hypothetical protein [Rubrivivax gelatinosus]MBK1712468.1 hypothetical protein [Rubrivivax gelatinosus]